SCLSARPAPAHSPRSLTTLFRSYTVFAPTNDAWEQMSGLSKDELMQPENREQLISLLRAHIVADDVDEQMARSLQQAQTIDGGRSEEHTSELQSRENLVCRLLLE